ncbi:MAG: hypothetical protein FJZ96_11980 [Chloroflexi bacterium]|nr:hypothetical protein [Chloroflexota bacterium]
MIIQYHRPVTIAESLELLALPDTLPLGGGTILNQRKEQDFSVVDLQALGLDKIHKVGGKLEIGATTRLQELLACPHIPWALSKALRLEAPVNLRNMSTAAGALVASDGRSPYAAAMLALDAKLTIDHEPSTSDPSSIVQGQTLLGDLLPLRESILRGRLITKIEVPLNIGLAYEQVARTPADRAIISVSLARWSSGRSRLVVGGWGKFPSLALDGDGGEGFESAIRNATFEASDEWASAEYRSEIALVLARRCLEAMKS